MTWSVESLHGYSYPELFQVAFIRYNCREFTTVCNIFHTCPIQFKSFEWESMKCARVRFIPPPHKAIHNRELCNLTGTNHHHNLIDWAHWLMHTQAQQGIILPSIMVQMKCSNWCHSANNVNPCWTRTTKSLWDAMYIIECADW